MIEIEARVKISKSEARLVEKKLKALLAKKVLLEKETSHYIDLPGKKILNAGKVLRIKEFDGHALLTFKGKMLSSKINERKETQVEVGDAKTLREIFKQAGLIETMTYSKTRKKFKLAGVNEVNIDFLPKFGFFVEVEAKTSKKVKEMFSKLGLDKKKLITKSYASIVRTGKW